MYLVTSSEEHPKSYFESHGGEIIVKLHKLASEYIHRNFEKPVV
jgi:hypothetical protein